MWSVLLFAFAGEISVNVLPEHVDHNGANQLPQQLAGRQAGLAGLSLTHLMAFFLSCGSEDTYALVSSTALCICISMICVWGGGEGSEINTSHTHRAPMLLYRNYNIYPSSTLVTSTTWTVPEIRD